MKNLQIAGAAGVAKVSTPLRKKPEPSPSQGGGLAPGRGE